MRPISALLASAALAVGAACTPMARPTAPARPSPVELPLTETVLLLPRDGGPAYRIWVGLPLGYRREPGRRYPVVYALDGDVGFAPAVGITRFLALTRELPELIIVGIGYGDDLQVWRDRRGIDLIPTVAAPRPGAGRGERFLQLLASEIVPLVERRYRAAPDRTLFGYSLGGLFATYVLFHQPALFRRYVIGSPTYLARDPDPLAVLARFRQPATSPAGLVYTSFGTPEAPAALAAWRTFWSAVAASRPPDLQLIRAETDETHPAGAWICLVKGLKAVFPPADTARADGGR